MHFHTELQVTKIWWKINYVFIYPEMFQKDDLDIKTKIIEEVF